MFFSRAPVLFEGFGSRANAPRTEMKLQTVVRRFFAQVTQIIVFKLLEGIQVGDEQRIGSKRCGIVNKLAGLPAQGANGEIVQAKFDGRFASCRRRSGFSPSAGQDRQSCGSHGCGLKESASSSG